MLWKYCYIYFIFLWALPIPQSKTNCTLSDSLPSMKIRNLHRSKFYPIQCWKRVRIYQINRLIFFFYINKSSYSRFILIYKSLGTWWSLFIKPCTKLRRSFGSWIVSFQAVKKKNLLNWCPQIFYTQTFQPTSSLPFFNKCYSRLNMIWTLWDFQGYI